MFVIILNSFFCKAQALQWAKQLSGTTEQFSSSIVVDASGNVYTTGYFRATTDFDPGVATYNLTTPGGSADTDIFVSKLDASGNFVWAKQLGGTASDYGNSIVVDTSGNIYTIGVFRGTADFDPSAATFNLTSAGLREIFISKLDASGNFVWAKQIGGTDTDEGSSIAVDAAGNIYTTGYFRGTVDFDPDAPLFNLTSTGTSVFVLKLDVSGNFVWAKQLGDINSNGYSIAVDASGNVYTTGSFAGTADFDPDVTTFNLTTVGGVGDWDIFVSKLDASGNFVWAKRLGGTDLDNGYSIAVDTSGNVYTTGSFKGIADFDPGIANLNLTSGGTDDIFVSKLDISGNFVWAKQLGGTGSDLGYSIALDASNNLYITGKFVGIADFDGGIANFNLTSAGSDDIFISKLDSLGNFIWANRFGSTNSDRGNSITLDATDNLFITGQFRGIVDFDPSAATLNLTSGTSFWDVFVLKMSQCSSVIDVSTNLTAGTITAVNQIGATYQWINCQNNNSPIIGEINQSYTPIANGNYAVIVTVGLCSSTSACVTVITTTTGILTNTINQTIKIYPNPNNGQFIIELNNNSQIIITDILGRLIVSEQMNAGKNILNLQSEPNGIYFVKISTPNGYSTNKILLNK